MEEQTAARAPVAVLSMTALAPPTAELSVCGGSWGYIGTDYTVLNRHSLVPYKLPHNINYY